MKYSSCGIVHSRATPPPRAPRAFRLSFCNFAPAMPDPINQRRASVTEQDTAYAEETAAARHLWAETCAGERQGKARRAGRSSVGELASRRRRTTMDARPRPPRLPILLLLLLAAFFGAASTTAAEGPASAPLSQPGSTAGMTELQKHAAFFDRDHDGIITVDETYQGLKDLGLGSVRAKASAALINAGLGPKTRPDNANSSRMDIYIANIQKGIHGSDTGAYDEEGRFVPGKLDEMFAKHGKTVPDAFTKDELDEMLKANREDMDVKGWLAASSEWNLLYKLAKDKDGFLRKDSVRAVYDGALFYQLAAQPKKEEV